MVWKVCRRIFLNLDDLVFLRQLIAQRSVFRLQIPLAALYADLPLGFLRLDAGCLEPVPEGIRADAQFLRDLSLGATFFGHQPDSAFLVCRLIAWRRFMFSFFL